MASQSLDDLAQQYLPISPLTSKADREYIQLHHYSFKEGYKARDTEVSSLQGDIKELVGWIEGLMSDMGDQLTNATRAEINKLISKHTKS